MHLQKPAEEKSDIAPDEKKTSLDHLSRLVFNFPIHFFYVNFIWAFIIRCLRKNQAALHALYGWIRAERLDDRSYVPSSYPNEV